MKTEKKSRYVLAYCTFAGLLASIVISGLLFSIDFISKTPSGTNVHNKIFGFGGTDNPSIQIIQPVQSNPTIKI